MSTRYDRQLPLIGAAGQEKLRQAAVGIIGCGGLGTNVVTALAAAGVGKLVLVDGSEPELSNLNRQFVFREGVRGNKAVLLAEWAGSLSPVTKVTACPEELTADHVPAALEQCGILVDCLDTIAARRMLNRYVLNTRRTLVHAGVAGWQGQVTVIVPGRTPCLECLFRAVKDPAVVPTIGAAVSAIGALEAAQVLMLLTGTGQPLIGRLLVLDIAAGTAETVPVTSDPYCCACGRL
ncbi:MAG: HesA/MoeB/ThiF family protein [Candidatus Methanomethylophilus sp.]|nr:HesA/MoeB/ThiF family protein [Methanomethylophilus sp.]MDD3232982.1 HesA/MoeB/ThiF family protein [Methanomethylophilus sp.]